MYNKQIYVVKILPSHIVFPRDRFVHEITYTVGSKINLHYLRPSPEYVCSLMGKSTYRIILLAIKKKLFLFLLIMYFQLIPNAELSYQKVRMQNSLEISGRVLFVLFKYVANFIIVILLRCPYIISNRRSNCEYFSSLMVTALYTIACSANIFIFLHNVKQDFKEIVINEILL